MIRYNLLHVGKASSFTISRFLCRRVYCMDIKRNTNIKGGCEILSLWNIHADRCVIALSCILDGRSGIFIGQDMVFGSGVYVWTQEHSVEDLQFRALPENTKPVTISNHAWIASDSTILPGLSLTACMAAYPPKNYASVGAGLTIGWIADPRGFSIKPRGREFDLMGEPECKKKAARATRF
jgi:hypothetical protein